MTDVVAKTEHGAVRGTTKDGIVSFKGIPYAAAPEGPLRFRPPTAPAGWTGVREAVAFGTAPPQRPPVAGAPASWRPGDGLDCLTVNVWSPDLGAVGLPVMVWIYGGRWQYGSSGMPQYDGAALARSGVVVVTLNYRVGFEGFGRLPGVPDNRGLRDQLAALEWVRANIAAFGGDPGDVTVFGQSAGAASVALHATGRRAEGLFRRVIAQSIPEGQRDPAEAEQITRRLAEAAGVEATWDGFAALPPEAILAVRDTLPGPAGPFAPVVDGDLVTGPPEATGLRRDVDLVCGFTREEYLGFGPVPEVVDATAAAVALGLGAEAATAYRAAYPGRTDAELFVAMASDALVRIPTLRTADAHAGKGGRVWVYEFAWKGPALGAAHCVDVPFVFGNADNRWAARLIGTPPAAGYPLLSERLRAAWIAFATTGDPGWPRYEPTRRRTRVWDTTPSDEDDPYAASRNIWAAAGPSPGALT